MDQYVPFLAAFVFTTGGVVFGRKALRDLRRAMRSPSWPTAQGEILEAGITYTGDAADERNYTARVRYRYLVGEREYEGKRVRFGGWIGSIRRKAIERIVSQYRPGNPVVVHYDPESPGSCVLQTGITIDVVTAVAIALLLLVAGLISPFMPPPS